jgi:hypothetical protein
MNPKHRGGPPFMPDQRSESRRVLIAVVAATVGTTIEWYDFFLYGTAAAIVFRQAFFPDLPPFVGQIRGHWEASSSAASVISRVARRRWLPHCS